MSLGDCGVDPDYGDRADSSRSSTGAESPSVPSEETSNLEEPWVRIGSRCCSKRLHPSCLLRRTPLECYFLPRVLSSSSFFSSHPRGKKRRRIRTVYLFSAEYIFTCPYETFKIYLVVILLFRYILYHTWKTIVLHPLVYNVSDLCGSLSKVRD